MAEIIYEQMRDIKRKKLLGMLVVRLCIRNTIDYKKRPLENRIQRYTTNCLKFSGLFNSKLQ